LCSPESECAVDICGARHREQSKPQQTIIVYVRDLAEFAGDYALGSGVQWVSRFFYPYPATVNHSKVTL
jgi:hypothetical protein